jgi:hypothetical protein
MSEDRDLAERQFDSEVARLFELQQPRPDMKEFKRKAVALCRTRLRSSDKPAGI